VAAMAPATGATADTCTPEAQPVLVRASGQRLIDTGCPAGVIANAGSDMGATVVADPIPDFDTPRLIRYTPPAAYASGPDEIHFDLDGVPQTIGVTVAPDADAPPRCLALQIPVAFDEAGSGALQCVDPDQDDVVFDSVTAPALGTVAAGAPAVADGVSRLAISYTLRPGAGTAAAGDAFDVNYHEAFGASPPSQAADVTVAIPADTPPACPQVSRSTPQATPFAFRLVCSDPDAGDVLTYAIVAPSLHSTMALDNAGAGSYAPVFGFSGADFFTFTASDGRAAAPVVPYNVNVGRPPPPRKVITSAIAAGFRIFPTYTSVARLAVTRIPSAARLQVRCAGRGCPFSVRTVKAARGRADAVKLFAGRRLRAAAVVEVRLSATGYVGKVTRYEIRSRKAPLRRDYCLLPGSTVARKRC
jgi:hypothetical protein